MKVLRAFQYADELQTFCKRILLTEKRPRLGRVLATDRELVHWTRTDWPALWDFCLSTLQAQSSGPKILATYVIRYRVGVELKPHKDSGAMRMIVLARAADSGGALSVESNPVELAVGDAVVFSDARTHAVTKVLAGERWTITMGIG